MIMLCSMILSVQSVSRRYEVKDYDRGGRWGRFLGLFTIVTFTDDECSADGDIGEICAEDDGSTIFSFSRLSSKQFNAMSIKSLKSYLIPRIFDEISNSYFTAMIIL